MPTKRAYASPLREKAAAQTREVILRAATELFGQRGYALVTVADIAAAAGVSPKTVFASVGSKREIMDHIIDAGVIAGRCDEAMEQLRQLRTPRDVLTALAAGTRFGSESQFTVHEAIRLALPVHEDGAALWERATRSSRTAMSDTAHHLHTLTPRPRYRRPALALVRPARLAHPRHRRRVVLGQRRNRDPRDGHRSPLRRVLNSGLQGTRPSRQ
jgi:AcrR family transcriptional regulator